MAELLNKLCIFNWRLCLPVAALRDSEEVDILMFWSGSVLLNGDKNLEKITCSPLPSSQFLSYFGLLRCLVETLSSTCRNKEELKSD